MIELAVFLTFQILINLLAKFFLSVSWQSVFKGASYLFVLLMLAYPFLVINFYYDNFYDDDAIKCGNVYIGLVFFLWVIGAPLVLITQFLFNTFLFRRIILPDPNKQIK